MIVTLGGDRLGSGNKMKQRMRNFERSSHDLSTIIRTSMAAGVITPVFCDIATVGTTYEMKIRELIRTAATTGPCYGSFEFRVEVFVYPIRLTQGMLHNNPIKLGLNAKNVLLPQIEIPLTTRSAYEKYISNGGNLSDKFATIGPSCLINYLGAQTRPIQGPQTAAQTEELSAGPILAYYDYIKDYKLNKQEDEAYVIGTQGVKLGIQGVTIKSDETNEYTALNFEPNLQTATISNPYELGLNDIIYMQTYIDYPIILIVKNWKNSSYTQLSTSGSNAYIYGRDTQENTDIGILYEKARGFSQWPTAITVGDGFLNENGKVQVTGVFYDANQWKNAPLTYKLALNPFPIENLDKARETILSNSKLGDKVTIKSSQSEAADDVINWLPYSVNAEVNPTTGISKNADTMNGLMVGCYKSDMFNNWLNTEWIDGENGINELSAIPVQNNQIMIEDLIVQKKVYTMLNRIAVADGTYRGYQEAVWGEEGLRTVESAVYCGGMSSEIMFDEVVSTSETEVDGSINPIGTLAGRGRTGNQKGGTIKIRIDEASWIMAVATITPRIDYDAACKFYMTELKSFYDLHKPSLDQIGFQNLPVSQMAGWNQIKNASAGKQPSWIQYQTNYNTVHGDFADDSKKGYMTLKRAYESEINDNGDMQVKDLTTYIDPTKYNRIFAKTNLESQNFEVQIAFDIIGRRKMSANQIPNL